MVRLQADAERGEKPVGDVSNDAAVRHVISALCLKTRNKGFAVLHGLMREILDNDAVLLDIVDTRGLHGHRPRTLGDRERSALAT